MSNHICFQISENCKNFYDSYGEICVGCNACGRINKDTALECWLEIEKRQQQENADDLAGGFELDADPKIRELQVKNMTSNVLYYEKKIKQIEKLIAERDAK